jgi:ubiquinone/menaquinone biosynthesis C-methylase UbiE
MRSVSSGFEDVASEWLAWARTPGHDAYWHYREAFFTLLPAAPRSVLEVGCGEGRVARDLAARGYGITGLDASPTLVAAAAESDPEGAYILGRAEALPFPDDSFEVVVAYNSLMDVEDMPRAVREAARVLRPGGRLCACVTHPVADAGGWEDERFVLTRSYRRGGPFRLCESCRGLTMTWTGRRHSLEDYAQALERAGLAIEAIREPGPAEGAPDRYARWSDVPMFLLLRARSSDPAA